MNKEIKIVEGYLKEEYPLELVEKIIKRSEIIYSDLCKENQNDSKAIKQHTKHNLFPCISLYKAMLEAGINQAEALTFMDKSWSRKAKKAAESTKKMLSLFGLYKLYPAMFETVAKKQFGEKAGFKAKFYDLGKGHCKFDMTECLFAKTCKRYNCNELLKCFCHTDDINNQDLHPKLIWNRNKYMGKGDEYCDFDIYVKK